MDPSLQNISTRKRRQVPSAVDITRQKKIKPSIIDCPDAIAILKELNLGEKFLNSGEVLAWVLQPTDPAFINIHDYVARGQPFDYGAKVVSILKIMAHADSLQNVNVPSDFNEDPQNEGQLRKMLWHGTSPKNVSSILQNGLILPKRNNGLLYGPGIYFADMLCKSLGYCTEWRQGNREWKVDKEGRKVAYLFLSDVLLGNSMDRLYGVSRFITPWFHRRGWLSEKAAKRSVQGCGLYTPDPTWDQVIDGCIWPLGRAKFDRTALACETGRRLAPFLGCKLGGIPMELFTIFTLELMGMSMVLQRNEYVVYDEKRVIPKYLIKVEITTKPFEEIIY